MDVKIQFHSAEFVIFHVGPLDVKSLAFHNFGGNMFFGNNSFYDMLSACEDDSYERQNRKCIFQLTILLKQL